MSTSKCHDLRESIHWWEKPSFVSVGVSCLHGVNDQQENFTGNIQESNQVL